MRCPSLAAEPECRLCGEPKSESDQAVVVAVVRTDIESGCASGVVNCDIPVLDGPDIPNSTLRSCSTPNVRLGVNASIGKAPFFNGGRRFVGLLLRSSHSHNRPEVGCSCAFTVEGAARGQGARIDAAMSVQ